jgi:hypothetical protein
MLRIYEIGDGHFVASSGSWRNKPHYVGGIFWTGNHYAAEVIQRSSGAVLAGHSRPSDTEEHFLVGTSLTLEGAVGLIARETGETWFAVKP